MGIAYNINCKRTVKQFGVHIAARALLCCILIRNKVVSSGENSIYMYVVLYHINDRPQEIISRKSTIEPLMALLKRDVSIQTQSGVLQLLWCFVRRDQR